MNLLLAKDISISTLFIIVISTMSNDPLCRSRAPWTCPGRPATSLRHAHWQHTWRRHVEVALTERRSAHHPKVLNVSRLPCWQLGPALSIISPRSGPHPAPIDPCTVMVPCLSGRWGMAEITARCSMLQRP